MKKNGILLAVMAFLFAGLCLSDLLAPVRSFSAQENRKLAQRPQLTLEGILDKTYMSDYEAYVTDQFPGRDSWIAAKVGTEKAMGKKDANGVYFAPDNTLLEKHGTESVDLEKARRKMQRLLEEAGRLAEQIPGKTGLLFVPSASGVQKQRLPAFAEEFDQEAYLKELQDAAQEAGLVYADAYQALLPHKEEAIYYGTDHHWSTLGAFYGYQAFAVAFGYPLPSLEDYDRQTVKEDFTGTLQAKVNLQVTADTMEVFRKKGEGEHEISFVYEGRRSRDLYFPAHLETKDAYAFYLDGNHPFLEITGDGPEHARILVIKDSYANCFIPFLTEHYGRIYVLDKRYYKESAEKVAADCQPTDVLYLYNIFQFIESYL